MNLVGKNTTILITDEQGVTQKLEGNIVEHELIYSDYGLYNDIEISGKSYDNYFASSFSIEGEITLEDSGDIKITHGPQPEEGRCSFCGEVNDVKQERCSSCLEYL